MKNAAARYRVAATAAVVNVVSAALGPPLGGGLGSLVLVLLLDLALQFLDIEVLLFELSLQIGYAELVALDLTVFLSVDALLHTLKLSIFIFK